MNKIYKMILDCNGTNTELEKIKDAVKAELNSESLKGISKINILAGLKKHGKLQ